MSDYNKALKKIMGDKSPVKATGRTRTEIEAAIAAISETLRGPLSNADRLCLVAERNDLRKELQCGLCQDARAALAKAGEA